MENVATYIERLVDKKVSERLEETPSGPKTSPQASEPAPLWSIDDVAEYLGVSPRQVHYFLADGQLTSVRVGRQHRFEPKAVQRAARGGLSTS
jgi:excisionase family DNA binding protein